MPDIRITVDGQPAITAEQAARRYGYGLSQMRTLFFRRKLKPVARLNPRMGLYDEEAVIALFPSADAEAGE